MIAKRRREDEHMRDVSQVWHGVLIYFKAQDKKRMPALSEFLPKPKVKTPEQQQTMMEMIAARYGLTIRKTRLIKVA